VTHWFALWPLRLLGARVYPCFHNALWPNMPGSSARGLGWLDRINVLSLPLIASGTLAVSPTIDRQIAEVCGSRAPPAWQFRAQFYRKDFEPPPPPDHSARPFRVAFAGRVEAEKGIFDILDMAETLRDEGVVFEICGNGTAFEAARESCRRRGLDPVVTFHGALDRPRLLDVYTRAHCVIVPTRSSFAEGMAMVAIESVLCGRPFISSPVVPALEVLQDAAVECQPDSVGSFVSAIRKLKVSEAFYRKLSVACSLYREQFLDGRMGLEAVLAQALLGKSPQNCLGSNASR
jgi:glycosyltransferase involved in cell wall biosynthesis